MSYDERIRMAAIVETLEFAILNSELSTRQIEIPLLILKELKRMAHPKAIATAT